MTAGRWRLLDVPRVAVQVGVREATVRQYLVRTRARIAEGLPVRAQDFPLPDEEFGRARTPAWLPETIDAWMDARPGRGAGGGRPRRCDPDPVSWFARGAWPECRCGYAPRDNEALQRHWADAGFRAVDEHGTIVTYPI